MATVFTNKYSEGYIGHRYYGGNQVVDVIENLAIERAKKIIFRRTRQRPALIRSPANASVYFGFLKPGDKSLV